MTEPVVRYVRIRHEDGREYAVLETDVATVPVGPDGETYEALGFVVYAYGDGTEYAPAPPP